MKSAGNYSAHRTGFEMDDTLDALIRNRAWVCLYHEISDLSEAALHYCHTTSGQRAGGPPPSAELVNTLRHPLRTVVTIFSFRS